MSLISTAADAGESHPLEAPAGYSANGKQRRKGARLANLYPLLALPVLILIARFLLRKLR